MVRKRIKLNVDMGEPRKIVLILGNGFDLDLGRKTSYKDFWESNYCPREYPSPLIHYLNGRLSDDIEKVRWYDMENALLDYYKDNIANGKAPDVLSDDEISFLNIFNPQAPLVYQYSGKYLGPIMSLSQKGFLKLKHSGVYQSIEIPELNTLLENTLSRDRSALQLIKERLREYLHSIADQPFNSETVALNVLYALYYASNVKGKATDKDFISIYSFNYTELPVVYDDNFKDCVHFVHGNYKKGKIIIGTRDEIGDEKEYCFLQKAFDPNYYPPPLLAKMLEADEVIFLVIH